jgi:hypothetical protein
MRGMGFDGLYGPARFGMKSVYGIDTTITRKIPMAQIKNGKPSQVAVVDWPADV